jgi:hypothetical protein
LRNEEGSDKWNLNIKINRIIFKINNNIIDNVLPEKVLLNRIKNNELEKNIKLFCSKYKDKKIILIPNLFSENYDLNFIDKVQNKSRLELGDTLYKISNDINNCYYFKPTLENSDLTDPNHYSESGYKNQQDQLEKFIDQLLSK